MMGARCHSSKRQGGRGLILPPPNPLGYSLLGGKNRTYSSVSPRWLTIRSHRKWEFNEGLISFSQIQPPSPISPTPPLFLPSDPPLAWLLAKTWVRNSDFQLHQLQYHLLNTHLLAEVIAVATMRCLPGLHPVFKVPPLPSTSYFIQTPKKGNRPISYDTACVHAKLLQSFLTLCSPTDYSPPGSSVHGILQARILEWVAMPSSGGLS